MESFPFDLLSMQSEQQKQGLGALRTFASSIHGFERQVSIAAVGGTLMQPVFQASAYRLEALSHAAVSGCFGGEFPRQRNLADWVNRLGGILGHNEDHAEDVFASRVVFEGTNFTVLEGLSEAGGYHLQLMLEVLEGMPNSFDELRNGCRAMLKLSTAACDKAGVSPFELGSEAPIARRISSSQLPSIRELTRWVSFSTEELDEIGVEPDHLRDYVLQADPDDVLDSYGGSSSLYSEPILDFDGELVIALPTAIGSAIRSAIIGSCLSFGDKAIGSLRMAHLLALTNRLSSTPMIRRIPMKATKLDLGPIVDSEPIEFEPGYWVHFVLAVDDLSTFEPDRLAGAAGNSSQVEKALSDSVKSVRAKCEDAPGFKAGMTYVAVCGFGRGQLLGMPEDTENWFVEAASSYDVEILGWRTDFGLSDLFTLSAVVRDLKSKGFDIRHMNGLAAQVGDALSNRGHLIPHESLPEGMPGGMLMAPINSQLKLRTEHHKRFDLQSIPTPEGTTVLVRREGSGSRSPGGVSHIYVSETDMIQGRLRAAWIKQDRVWWFETVQRTSESKGSLWVAFEAQRTWFERIAPRLDASNLELPNSLLWTLCIDPQPPTPADSIELVSIDEIKNAIEVSVDEDAQCFTTTVNLDFWRGLSSTENVAEAQLVRSALSGAIQLAKGGEHELSSLLSEVVLNAEARQLHLFAPQDFRDHMRDTFDTRVVEVSKLQDGAIRIGLGWSGVERPGGTLKGVEQCTEALNAITIAAEDALCKDLMGFDRQALISSAIRNHEAAEVDRRRWNRTSGSIVALSSNEDVVRSEIAENFFKLNGVAIASRVLIEIGLHHCPENGGQAVADMDLARLMARALMVVHLGGYSDGIRYGAMRPEIRISPAGEVQIDVDYYRNVMDPVGKDFSDIQIEQARSAYGAFVGLSDPPPDGSEDERNATFEKAWEAEFGVEFDQYRIFMDELEDICGEANQAWVQMSRNELVERVEKRVADAEVILRSLESTPRKEWRTVPEGFFDADRQPWRFRRRLSLARCPIVRLANGTDADVVIAPGIIREGFVSTVGNMFEGHYEASALTSREMRRWSGAVAKDRGRDFENEVADRLRAYGWTARTGVSFGEILGVSPEEDPGDIDVLAWHPEGRIVVLECKSLMFAKTPSEVAKQLSKYRGQYDTDGRPDSLARHLERWKLVESNMHAFETFAGLASAKFQHGLVFSNTVPMQFALDQIKKKLWVGTVDQLEIL